MSQPHRNIPKPVLIDPAANLSLEQLTTDSQAARIIQKFGGARNLSRIFQRMGRPKKPSSIYRWMYPKEKGGTGGWIPTAAWPDVLEAARIEGLFLDFEELDPRYGKKSV